MGTRSRSLVRAVVLATAAALLGSLVPAAHAADPIGMTPCTGVQPGAVMEDDDTNIYTMGFFFVNPKDKSVYFTTIGDLILTSPGTKVWARGKGPIVRDDSGRKIGRFAYAYRRETPDAMSFALVRLEPKIKWKGSVCHFGGPTGTYTRRIDDPVTLQFYGQGVPFFFATPARTATATTSADPETMHAQGPVGPFDLGDGGAPVLTGGKAVGIITGAVGGSIGAPPDIGFQVARLGPWVSRAQKSLKISLKLQTARAA